MKAINKTKMITMGLVTLFILGFTQPSLSYPQGQIPVELKSIGNVDNSPLFQLKANNAEIGEYFIRVKDFDGNLLYSEKLKGKNILRKYRLDMSEADLNEAFRVRFEVTNIKTHETFVYNVTRSNRTVDEIVVAKL